MDNAPRPRRSASSAGAASFRAAVLCMVLVLAGCSNNAPSVGSIKQTAGGLTVNLETQPSPLHSGDNTLILTITDAGSGAPVGNANITVNANMVAPKISGMDVSGRAQGNGRFEVPVRLALATKYDFKVHIVQTGRPPVDMVFTLEAPH